jgi:orotate phosphoribosyltransferase
MEAWAAELGRRITPCNAGLVCGPRAGGAALARLIAMKLGTEWIGAERSVQGEGPVRYRVPEAHRGGLPGREVLLVDDAINAGWAVEATLRDLLACGARPVGIACLLALGDAAARIAERQGVPLVSLATVQREIWDANECPLCAAGAPLDATS